MLSNKHNDKPIRQLLIFGWHVMRIKSKLIVFNVNQILSIFKQHDVIV